MDRRENVILLGPPAVSNWLVAARLVGGRVAKPVTHSSTESNTRLGVRPHAQSVQFSFAINTLADRPLADASDDADLGRMQANELRAFYAFLPVALGD